jgi:hypothetical protein
MIVECGQCKTKFKVSDDKITPAGVKVRCSKCKHIFTVVRGAAESVAPGMPARIPPVEQPLSQPPGGDRGFGSQIESKPIKKDSSWPPSFRPEDFQLSQVPDKIDQRMVDQIDLDSDEPLSLFNKDMPPAEPAPVPRAQDALFHPLPSPQAVPGNIRSPTISFDKLPNDQFSAYQGTKTALDANAPQRVFEYSTAAARSLPGEDLFANVNIDVQVGSEAPPLPARPIEPPPLRPRPDGTPSNENQAVSPNEDGGVFVGNDPFADLEGYQSAPAEGGSELTLDMDGKMFGGKTQSSQALSTAVDNVNSPAESSPVVAKSAPLPMADQSPLTPEKSPLLPWLYKIGLGVVAVVGLLLLVMVFRSGGKPDLINGSTNEVLVKKITATTYRNINGHKLLLFLGEVYYSSNESLTGITVTGHVLSDTGKLLGEYAVPAGVVFTPNEIYQMGDASVVVDNYTKKIEELKGKKLPPRGSLPFMIVAYDHPEITGEIVAKVVPSIVKD